DEVQPVLRARRLGLLELAVAEVSIVCAVVRLERDVVETGVRSARAELVEPRQPRIARAGGRPMPEPGLGLRCGRGVHRLRGSRVAFVAGFLGRRLAYTYEVETLTPGERLVMRTADGPFPMETTYGWEDTPGGGTKMTLRNRGEPAGFSRVATPVLSRAMGRA